MCYQNHIHHTHANNTHVLTIKWFSAEEVELEALPKLLFTATPFLGYCGISVVRVTDYTEWVLESIWLGSL